MEQYVSLVGGVIYSINMNDSVWMSVCVNAYLSLCLSIYLLNPLLPFSIRGRRVLWRWPSCVLSILWNLSPLLFRVHRFRGRPLGLPSLYLCSIACCGMLSGGILLMCANHLICWLLIYSRIGMVPVLGLPLALFLFYLFTKSFFAFQRQG